MRKSYLRTFLFVQKFGEYGPWMSKLCFASSVEVWYFGESCATSLSKCLLVSSSSSATAAVLHYEGKAICVSVCDCIVSSGK